MMPESQTRRTKPVPQISESRDATDWIWRCPGCGLDMPSLPGVGCHECGGVLREQDGIVSVVESFRPPSFSSDRRTHLESLEKEHFWFGPRHRLLERTLLRILPSPPRTALELGCGTGRFLPVLARTAASVVAVEGHLESLRGGVAHETEAQLIHADVEHVPLGSNQFDLVTSFDVLEHVSPKEFLGEVVRLLRPGGTFLVSVPALPSLWSTADEVAGHRCRYDITSLRGELESAGLRVDGYTHYQMLLLPLIYLRLASRAAQRLERRPPKFLANLLENVNAFEVSVLGGVRVPIGSSLIAWAHT